jgi:hypothetical protein
MLFNSLTLASIALILSLYSAFFVLAIAISCLALLADSQACAFAV